MEREIADMKLVAPKRDAFGRSSIIVLDRIEPGVTPPYCLHGQVTCLGGCGEWCWLGDKTYRIVAEGEAAPLCTECATKLVPPGTVPINTDIHDHRREDGPHD